MVMFKDDLSLKNPHSSVVHSHTVFM